MPTAYRRGTAGAPQTHRRDADTDADADVDADADNNNLLNNNNNRNTQTHRRRGQPLQDTTIPQNQFTADVPQAIALQTIPYYRYTADAIRVAIVGGKGPARVTLAR